MIVLACFNPRLSFALGAAGVVASVNWDQLGKASLVAALIASQYGGR